MGPNLSLYHREKDLERNIHLSETVFKFFHLVAKLSLFLESVIFLLYSNFISQFPSSCFESTFPFPLFHISGKSLISDTICFWTATVDNGLICVCRLPEICQKEIAQKCQKTVYDIHISINFYDIFIRFSTLSNCYAVDTSNLYNRISIQFHNDQFLFRKCADFLFSLVQQS